MTNKFHFSLLRWNAALVCLFLLVFPDAAHIYIGYLNGGRRCLALFLFFPAR